MHLQNPPYRILKMDSECLTIETDSGNNIIIIIFCFILILINELWIYPAILLCFILWTYKKKWIIDKYRKSITCEKSFIGMSYEDVKINYSEIVKISISRLIGYEGTNVFGLFLNMRNGHKMKVTVRSSKLLLKPMIEYLISYLPDEIKVNGFE